jgi:hypothetical protein
MNHAIIKYPTEEVLGAEYIPKLKEEFVRQVTTRLKPQSRFETALDDDVLISRLYIRIKLDSNG